MLLPCLGFLKIDFECPNKGDRFGTTLLHTGDIQVNGGLKRGKFEQSNTKSKNRMTEWSIALLVAIFAAFVVFAVPVFTIFDSLAYADVVFFDTVVVTFAAFAAVLILYHCFFERRRK